MIASPRVVLVGHDASTTGAPLAALAFARWARATGAADVEVHLDRGGPLVPRFEAIGVTRVRGRATTDVVAAFEALGGPSAGRWARRGAALATRSVPDPDVTIVAASTAAWPSAVALAGGGRRVVLWLHELDGVADRIVSARQRRALLDATSRIVAVGERVATMAIDRWGVAPARVSVVESFIDDLPHRTVPPEPAGRPSHDLIGVGSLVPRKGADHLVALTALLRTGRPSLTSAWVGGPLDSPFADLIRTDRTAAGLEGALDLVGPVDDVGPWWPTHGVVVHLAREDPAPLVVIEAGQRGIPVVTWDTGGAADLLAAAGLGHLVTSPGDLVGVAEAVADLLDDEPARRAAGHALRTAVASRSTEVLAPSLLAAITGSAA